MENKYTSINQKKGTSEIRVRVLDGHVDPISWVATILVRHLKLWYSKLFSFYNIISSLQKMTHQAMTNHGLLESLVNFILIAPKTLLPNHLLQICQNYNFLFFQKLSFFYYILLFLSDLYLGMIFQIIALDNNHQTYHLEIDIITFIHFDYLHVCLWCCVSFLPIANKLFQPLILWKQIFLYIYKSHESIILVGINFSISKESNVCAVMWKLERVSSL